MSDPARGPAVYRYEDEDGRVHFVDALDKVPETLHSRIERLPPRVGPAAEVPKSKSPGDFVRSLDVPSVGVGIAIGLVLVFLGSLVRGSAGWLVRAGVLLAVATLLGGAYLNWVQQSAGLGDEGIVATPSEIVEEAKKASRKLEKRLQSQRKTLEQLERGP